MKRFIRYLYEYEQGKRLRNVGFVKVEQKDEDCTLNIHGKGLHMKGERKLELYLFFDEGDGCVGIWQGTVDNVNPAINYRLFYTKEDVIAPENFQRINGIILESETGRKYAAVWNDGVIDVGRMRVLKPDAEGKEDVTGEASGQREEIPSMEVEAREDSVGEELLRQQEPEGDEEVPMQEEPVQPEMSDLPSHSMQAGIPVGEESIRDEPVEDEPAEDEPFREEAVGEGIVEEISNKENRAAENIDAFPKSGGEMEFSQELTAEPIGNICGDTRERMPKEHLRCTKIQRNDMARLPRCEWKWANNSFLLHGYYNYHHLAIIDDGERYRLGVPGIYHPQEAKAASTFGFTEFIPHKDMDMDLTDEEKSSQGQFGYWCRPIKRMLKTQ